MTIRILLVDDHSVVRKGLRTFLTYDPEVVEVVFPLLLAARNIDQR